MSTSLGFEARIHAPFEDAVERVTDALREQGFGVLTRIDVRKTLEEKLGENFRDYMILGACNPRLAHRALSAQPEVGLMLPCNVTVEQEPSGSVLVRFADPETMLTAGGFETHPDITSVAKEARGLLGLAAESLAEAE